VKLSIYLVLTILLVCGCSRDRKDAGESKAHLELPVYSGERYSFHNLSVLVPDSFGMPYDIKYGHPAKGWNNQQEQNLRLTWVMPGLPFDEGMTTEWEKPITVLGKKTVLLKAVIHSRPERNVFMVYVDSDSSRHILEGENFDEMAFRSIVASLVLDNSNDANKILQQTATNE